jgi:hypothetical protein
VDVSDEEDDIKREDIESFKEIDEDLIPLEDSELLENSDDEVTIIGASKVTKTPKSDKGLPAGGAIAGIFDKAKGAKSKWTKDTTTPVAGEQPGEAIDASLQSKVDFLLSMAKHIPGNVQERYTQTIMDLGILAGESLGALADENFDTTSVPRLELFLDAVGSLIRDHGMSTHMYIDNLIHMPLGDWQQAHPDIESPFTREEMEEFCAELQSRDDFE